MQNTRQRSQSGHEPVELYTPAEAGARIHASEMHVYRLVAAGELRAVDISKPGAKRTKTRIRSDDLADYIERCTRGRVTA